MNTLFAKEFHLTETQAYFLNGFSYPSILADIWFFKKKIWQT